MDVITDRSLSLRATAKLNRFVAVVDEAVEHFPVSSRSSQCNKTERERETLRR